MATPTTQPLRTMHRLKEIYLLREEPARYDTRIAFAAALAVGTPLTAGVSTGHTRAGVVMALAAWVTVLAVPKSHRRARTVQLLTRTALLTAATTLGALVGGMLWATAAASAALALLVPVPYAGGSPLICMVTATVPQPGISTPEHVLLFLTGCLWATALLLLPVTGGPYSTTPGPHPSPASATLPPWTALREAVTHKTPEFRHAVRVCACFTSSYTFMTLLHLPHANWALVGILTTLRADWSRTRSRIVKRLTGMLAGCLFTAPLLALTTTPLAAALAITVCGGIARPMRQFNYGFWPVFATPVLLLLTDFSTELTWVDVTERLTTNALGALIAAIAMLLWPAPAHPADL
ncbi:FUSC family protein [Streptomyces cinnamoneus]|uniref:FUSC family protein n=1 Tax=Streptomyces cinnamoneus TaxID=53446 RepID=UPI00378F7A86